MTAAAVDQVARAAAEQPVAVDTTQDPVAARPGVMAVRVLAAAGASLARVRLAALIVALPPAATG